MIHFPGTGTNAERTTDVVRIGRGVIYMPKTVHHRIDWWDFFPNDKRKARRR